MHKINVKICKHCDFIVVAKDNLKTIFKDNKTCLFCKKLLILILLDKLNML